VSKVATLAGLALVAIFLGFWTANFVYPDLSQIQRREERIIPLDIEHISGQVIENGKCTGYTYHFPLKTSKGIWKALDGYLLIEARSSVNQVDNLLTSKRLPIFSLIFKQKVTIQIPDQKADLEEGCYIYFQSNTSPGAIKLYASSEDAYQGGTLMLDGSPQQGDLAFTSFKKLSFEEIIRRTVIIHQQFIQLLFITVLYIVLGWLFLWTLGESAFGPIIALVTGLVLVVLSMTAASLVGLKFTRLTLLVLIIALFIVAFIRIVARWFHDGKPKMFRLYLLNGKTTLRKLGCEDIVVACLFILVLWTRLLQTADLPAAPWVDAFFHAYIIKGFEESALIPLDLNYPFGFHVVTYVNGLLSNWTIPDTLLFTGQWLSAISGLAFYSFTKSLFHNKTTALIGAILFWFISPFPAYLTNWSRFPILMGMIISFAFLEIYFGWIRYKNRSWILLALTLLVLAITHYSSVVLALFVVFSWWIISRQWTTPSALLDDLQNMRKFTKIWKWAFILLSPVILYLLFRIYSLINEGQFLNIISENRQLASQVNFLYYLRLALQNNAFFFWLIGISGSYYLFLRHRREFNLVFSWIGLMTVFVVMQLLLIGGSFPGTNNLFIWAFIPIAIAGGRGLTNLYGWVKGRVGVNLSKISFITLITTVTLATAWAQIGSLNPRTILAPPNEEDALIWAQQNIPPRSTILINAFAWGDEYQPSDSGGWLPYWGDFHVWYPKNNEECNNASELIRTENVQYWYQGQGVSCFENDLAEGYFRNGSVIFDDNDVRIIKIVLQ